MNRDLLIALIVAQIALLGINVWSLYGKMTRPPLPSETNIRFPVNDAPAPHP